MNKKTVGLTYAQAGVDIDAGNRLVDLIRPVVLATRRPGAGGEIGGFDYNDRAGRQSLSRQALA